MFFMSFSSLSERRVGGGGEEPGAVPRTLALVERQFRQRRVADALGAELLELGAADARDGQQALVVARPLLGKGGEGGGGDRPPASGRQQGEGDQEAELGFEGGEPQENAGKGGVGAEKAEGGHDQGGGEEAVLALLQRDRGDGGEEDEGQGEAAPVAAEHGPEEEEEGGEGDERTNERTE